MTKSYTCPKCGGSDYFMSNRNVMKGVGGIYGNRGGVKQFPVCKVCDEIMNTPPGVKVQFSKRTNFLLFPGLAGAISSYSLPMDDTAVTLTITLLWVCLILGAISMFVDVKKAREL
jgi:hypothetical protein